jgi:hypothetical protein
MGCSRPVRWSPSPVFYATAWDHVYSHVTPAMHREAARVMDELLSR